MSYRYKLKSGKERADVFTNNESKEECETFIKSLFDSGKYLWISLYQDGQRILRLE